VIEVSDMEFSIPVELPLDADGFIRRECPHCEQKFKWHSGPANAEAEQQPAPETYYCPLCGQPAGLDSWWTREQLEYAEEAATPTIMEAMDAEVDKMFKGVKSTNIKVTRTGRLHTPEPPMPITEPNDMVIVTSPCHAWEPIKVPEERTGRLHCLLCGAAFAV